MNLQMLPIRRTSSGLPLGSGYAVAAGYVLAGFTPSAITGFSGPIDVFGSIGTTSGIPAVVQNRSGVFGARWLRKTADLTFEELARLLRVSRRSIHLWENGQPVSRASETAIEEAVRFLESLGDLPPAVLHGILLTPISRGTCVIDQVLRDPKQALAAARVSQTRPHGMPVVSKAARMERAPTSPIVLLSAVEVPVQSDSGKGRRVAKTVRNRAT